MLLQAESAEGSGGLCVRALPVGLPSCDDFKGGFCFYFHRLTNCDCGLVSVSL